MNLPGNKLEAPNPEQYTFDPLSEYEDFNLKIRVNQSFPLEFIPWKARKQFARILKNNDITNPTKHAILSCFPKCILTVPVQSGSKSKARKSTSNLVVENLKLWEISDLGKRTLLQRLFDVDNNKHRICIDDNLLAGNIRRAVKM